jgi:hypothetical protein
VYSSLHGCRRIHDVTNGVTMNRQDAQKMNEHLESMIQHANHVLFIVNNSGDNEIKERVQRVLGKVVAELDFEVMESIYKQFPDLKPADL